MQFRSTSMSATLAITKHVCVSVCQFHSGRHGRGTYSTDAPRTCAFMRLEYVMQIEVKNYISNFTKWCSNYE